MDVCHVPLLPLNRGVEALDTAGERDVLTVNSYSFLKWNVHRFWEFVGFHNKQPLLSWMLFIQIFLPVAPFMMHRVFAASDNTFIQPSLEQRFGCGTPNLFAIFEMLYDLWIPVVKAPFGDLQYCAKVMQTIIDEYREISAIFNEILP